ncbi:MAG: TIGR04168 family protein [Planctomycetota bacterium]
MTTGEAGETERRSGKDGEGWRPRRGREILVLGDLHGCFDDRDLAWIEDRAPELVLFVGDLGDEDPDIVRRIRQLQVPYRVMLGNHDAWFSFRHDVVSERLAEILELLGDRHLAYRLEELPTLGLSLLGGRPFSWGGPSLRSAPVYEALYKVRTQEDSARRIVDEARAARGPILILAHNGPKGLGSHPGDIYGKDFGKPGGDWGDLDLALALERIKDMGKQVPLVVAGHMHHRLVTGRNAERRQIERRDGTVYVNPARVPRILATRTGDLLHHYLSIHAEAGRILHLDQLLVSEGEVRRKSLLARLDKPEAAPGEVPPEV